MGTRLSKGYWITNFTLDIYPPLSLRRASLPLNLNLIEAHTGSHCMMTVLSGSGPFLEKMQSSQNYCRVEAHNEPLSSIEQPIKTFPTGNVPKTNYVPVKENNFSTKDRIAGPNVSLQMVSSHSAVLPVRKILAMWFTNFRPGVCRKAICKKKPNLTDSSGIIYSQIPSLLLLQSETSDLC